MESILLLISDPNLRQLYHELLIYEHVEIIPVAKIENAIIIEAFENVKTIIIYPDDVDSRTVERYLQLHKKVSKFSGTRFVLLTSDPDQYSKLLKTDDRVINITRLDPDSIIK